MERTWLARWLSVCAVLIAVLSLAACGGGSQSVSGGEEAGMSASGSAGDLPSSGGGGLQASSSGVGVFDTQASLGDFDRKIVKTSDLAVRAENVRESAERAQQAAVDSGGSVMSSRISREDGEVYADLELSVPSEEFEAALEELRGLGERIETDSVRGEDVTEEYVDLESRERNLLAAEESLISLYDRAASVNDTLRVQRELTNVRGEIETVQGRLKYLDERTAFSRINLTVQPLASSAPPETETAWQPALVAARAWDASLLVLQAMATAVISAAVFGWWLAPLLVVAFVWWRRRVRGSATADS